MTGFTRWEDIQLGEPDPAVYADEAQITEMRELVYRMRKDAGLSQAQLAERMGSAQPLVSRLEAGGVRPTLDTLRKVAAACGAELTITAASPSAPDRTAVLAPAGPTRC